MITLIQLHFSNSLENSPKRSLGALCTGFCGIAFCSMLAIISSSSWILIFVFFFILCRSSSWLVQDKPVVKHFFLNVCCLPLCFFLSSPLGSLKLPFSLVGIAYLFTYIKLLLLFWYDEMDLDWDLWTLLKIIISPCIFQCGLWRRLMDKYFCYTAFYQKCDWKIDSYPRECSWMRNLNLTLSSCKIIFFEHISVFILSFIIRHSAFLCPP